MQKIKARDSANKLSSDIKSRNRFERGTVFENNSLRKSHKTCLTINFDLTSE